MKELVLPSCFLARDIKSHCHSAYKLHCSGVLQHFVLQHLSCFSKLQIIWASAEFCFLVIGNLLVLPNGADMFYCTVGATKIWRKIQVILSLTCQLGNLSPLLVNGFS